MLSCSGPRILTYIMTDLGGFQFEMTLKATTNTKVIFEIFIANLIYRSLAYNLY